METALNLQFQLAREAGPVTLEMASYETWLEEYKHHWSMVYHPLPFGLFRMKFEQLDRLFRIDPKGEQKQYDKLILNLCNELGY